MGKIAQCIIIAHIIKFYIRLIKPKMYLNIIKSFVDANSISYGVSIKKFTIGTEICVDFRAALL